MNKHIFEQKIRQRIEQFERIKNEPALFAAVKKMETALRQGNKILIFGNGGSATQSSHFVGELINRFYFDRAPLPAVALVADIANLTCIANDSDYKYVFSKQVEALGKPGDIAIGISTSGTSANVLEAFKKAKEGGLTTIALCGQFTEQLQNIGIHVIIPVKSGDTPVIQEIHLFFLHMMAEILEKNIFAGDK